jgi:Zn-dependent M28 family amino/carboxypeptidase
MRSASARWSVAFVSLLMFAFATGCRLVAPGSDLDAAKLESARSAASEVQDLSVRAYMTYFKAARCFFGDPAEIVACEASIVGAFKAMGYADGDIRLDPVTVPGIGLYDSAGKYRAIEGPFTMDNIIVTKRGSDPGLRPVLVAAHYDTVADCPGADDNGSGCAGVLEIARILKDKTFPRGLVFAVFAFEEPGLLGSSHYVDGLADAELPVAAYVLETMGFTSAKELPIPLVPMPSEGNFLGVISAQFAQAEVFDFLQIGERLDLGLPLLAVNADANVSSNVITSNLLRSDHAPLCSRAVAALMITDTANFRDGNHYHQKSDTVDYIDFPFMEKAIKATLAAAFMRASK